MTTLKKNRLFWAWEDHKEEKWLREMSQEGWHFQSVSYPGKYTFTKGEPTDYVYRLDYPDTLKYKEEYLQIFEDADWDHIGEMNNWQYFRQEAVEGQTSKIFTDSESKAKRYQRMMIYMIIPLPILISLVMINDINLSSPFSEIFSIGAIVLMLGYIYIMANLIGRVSQLRK